MYEEANFRGYKDKDLDEWLDRVKISPPVVVALAFVMDRSGRAFVTHAIRLLMKMLSKVTNENELKMSAVSFIDKGARLSKLVEGAARNPDEKSIMQMLCTFECAIRIDELWDTLKDHYTGQNSMINKEITVKDLRDKIANTSPANLGSLNQTYPPQTLAEQFFSIDLLKKKEKSVAIENSIFQVKINRNVILVYRFLLIFEALFY